MRVKRKQKSRIAMAGISEIGARAEQQDAMWFSGMPDGQMELATGERADGESALAVIADGMGGLSSGAQISSLIVEGMRDAYFAEDRASEPVPFLQQSLWRVNESVNQYLLGKAPGGSTVIAAYIEDKKLYYCSVGDSRIYWWHKKRLCRLNVEHNYGRDLDELARRGVITEEEAKGDIRRAALTSYIGKGILDQVDGNEIPIVLEKGDVILLLTDGAFRTVSDEELARYAERESAEQIAQAIARAVVWEQKQHQDNYTIVAVRIEE
ncbi:MAG: serine/threonine-protein phosphatase [Lachnospiraceae bacterium]|nr:serine/threonine-protein phosphatase [Lachnospiraceae bacterium]